MKPTLTVLLAVSGFVLAANEPMEKVRITHTERSDFPAGGLLRFKHSSGELTVEGWDRPDVEITTVKSSQDFYAPGDRQKISQVLDKVRISVEHQSDGLTITTTSPRRIMKPGFDLD